jgi:hypothetical protein
VPVVPDVEAHNAEVEAVWRAYHAGRPTRVPIVVGTNVRYTMPRRDANPDAITFEQYFADPARQLQRQLEHQLWVRHHVPVDSQMGLPSAWSVGVDFQNVYEAAWFGCPITFRADQVPDTEPLLADEGRKRRLFDEGVPDAFSGPLMARGWDCYAFLRAQVDAGFEFAGRPLQHVGMCGLGTDGPVTVACNLRGATEFLTDLLAEPDYAQELLAFITDATIARLKAIRAHLGQPLTTPGWGFADDSIALLSTQQYRELVLPHHHRLVQAFSEGGPNSIHLCGDATRHFRLLRDELNIQSFDTGYPVDFAWLRAELGEGVTIQGGPSVPFLCAHTPDEVEAETRRILDSGIRRGGRFILREGNNLPAEAPLANVHAMIAAGRRWGRYEETL